MGGLIRVGIYCAAFFVTVHYCNELEIEGDQLLKD